MEPILKVENLRTSFHTREGVFEAVAGVDFSLEKGKTLGIVGESGCGKTVTCLSILKLLSERTARIEEGSSICFEGQELVSMSSREMYKIRGDKIAMIFQDSMTALNPVMTVGKQIAETLQAHKKLSRTEAKKKGIEMLELVGIPEPVQRYNEYPHQLSGGMRQRVMIAMALCLDPDILIADEPTTALDVTIQAQILRLMRDLQKRMDTSIILITHDMGVVAEMADDIMVMYAGYAVEYAERDEIFDNPLHPYTKGLLASIPQIEKDVEYLNVIEGRVPSLKDMPVYCRFYDRCPFAGEECRKSNPPLYNVNGHKVRCHLYKDKVGENK